MKVLTLLSLVMLSLPAMAQDFLTCEFNITDNKTKRDLKELRESKTQRKIELYEGLDHSEEIFIDKLIAHPGEKKTDKYQIRAFEDDTREEKVSQEEDARIVRLENGESIELNVSYDGHTTVVNAKTNASSYRLRFRGHTGATKKHSFYVYSKFSYLKKDKARTKLSPIIVTCQIVPSEIILETEIKKGEISPLEQERRIKQGFDVREN